MRSRFEIEYGSSIEDFLESVYVAGIDLSDRSIEQHAKCIERSHRMLKLLDTSIDLLHTKHKNRESYYWLLYFSFLSTQQLRNVEEIIEKLRPHIRDISFRTYYRRRRLTHSVLSCGSIRPRTASIFWRSSFRMIRMSGKKNKKLHLPRKARTVGEMIAVARQESSARKLEGHDIMALERFDPEVTHMIVFDVLSGEASIGDKDDRMRLFLTESGYKKALENQDKAFIQILNHAKVVQGHLKYDQLDRDL